MKTIVMLLLATSSALAAQAPTSDASPALAVRGAMLAFVVPDLDASAKWYAEKLGVRIVHLYPRIKTVHARAALFQGSGLIVELVEEDDAVDPGPEHRRGLQKAGLVVGDFDKAVATLRARGVEFASVYPRRPDQPANVTIRDNAGNSITLYEGFSSFNDPLIGLVQVDQSEDGGCFQGRVVGDTVVSNRGLSGVTVALYTKSPSGVAMGDAVASATSDASGSWKLPHTIGPLIITFVPPRGSGYRAAFTVCTTSGTQPLLMTLPHR